MNIDDLKYYTTINGLRGYKSEKDALIGEMVRDYDIAHQNLITRYSVIRNTIDGKDIFINFSDTPTRGVIGVKKRNGATSDMEEIVQVDPNLIKRGSYISFKYNETDTLNNYIVTSRIEKKNGYDEGVFLICNNCLNAKGWDKPICAYFNNSSYGDKGVLDTDFLTSIDGKLYCLIQDNDITKNIPLDMRFIFDHDKNEVYKVVKTETTVTGLHKLRRITFDKDTTQEAKDDFANNIAYNSFLDTGGINPQPTPSNSWNIISDDGNLSIGRMRTRIFSVVDSNKVLSTDNWTISVDQTGLTSGFITINKTTSNSISITNNNGYSTNPIKICFLRESDNYKLEVEVRLVK
jgi:hypothetical protein